jgi:hypothetical protein
MRALLQRLGHGEKRPECTKLSPTGIRGPLSSHSRIKDTVRRSARFI